MFEIELFICIKMDLTLNNLQWLICYQTKSNQTHTHVCVCVCVSFQYIYICTHMSNCILYISELFYHCILYLFFTGKTCKFLYWSILSYFLVNLSILFLFFIFYFLSATASCAIVNFLEVESPQENNRGWILLQTLNLLSTGSQALVDCMTAASLPSTLVKCLYLFFDLPSVPCTDVLEDGYEFTPKERRILLQKVFVQVKFCFFWNFYTI